MRAPFLFAWIVAASLLAGCNSIFGISKGQPAPTCVGKDGLLIDDMEDGNPSICELKAGKGAWYSVGDGTNVTGNATLALENAAIPGKRDGSRRAMHFSGAGFTSWGAIAGLNLNVMGLCGQGVRRERDGRHRLLDADQRPPRSQAPHACNRRADGRRKLRGARRQPEL